MSEPTEMPKEGAGRVAARAAPQKMYSGGSGSPFVDNRSGTTAQRKPGDVVSDGVQTKSGHPLQARGEESPFLLKGSRKNKLFGCSDHLSPKAAKSADFSIQGDGNRRLDTPLKLQAHTGYSSGLKQLKPLPSQAWRIVQQEQERAEPGLQFKSKALNYGGLRSGERAQRASKSAAVQRKKHVTPNIQDLARSTLPESSLPIQRWVPVNGVAGAKYLQDSNKFVVAEVNAPAATADYAPAPGVPATDPNKAYAGGEAGYLVNISSMNVGGAPANVDQGDLKARISVRRYQEGFDDVVEAKNRLRMVVNVNEYNNPLGVAPTVNGILGGERAAVAGVPGKASIIGHTWEHTWSRSDTGAAVGVPAVRADYGAALAGGATPAKLAKGYRTRFRYGKMREYTFNHPETANFKAQLAARNLQVFMHAGDGDVISVKNKGVGKGIYDRVDAYRAAGKQGIKLIGGGITNQGVNHDGDAPADQAWGIKTVHDLDMSHREAMAGEYPNAPWMTEPNTFIDYDVLDAANKAQANWELWDNYMVDFGSALGNLFDVNDADFNFSQLSIVSSANSHHMPLNKKTGVQTVDANLDSAKFAEAIFRHKDTSVNPSAWLRRLAYFAVPDLEQHAAAPASVASGYGPNLQERAKWMAGKILEAKEVGIANNDMKVELDRRLQGQLKKVGGGDKVAIIAPPWHGNSIAMVNDMADNLIDILNQANGLFLAAMNNAHDFNLYGADNATYQDTIAGAPPANLIKS